jgi:hypothetical protein
VKRTFSSDRLYYNTHKKKIGDEIKHLAICRAHEIEHLAISLLFPPPLSPKEPPYLTSCLTPTPSFWLQNKMYLAHFRLTIIKQTKC